ncbi:MAG: hypothetical protein V4671_04630 [Armatimonadota bacterium]
MATETDENKFDPRIQIKYQRYVRNGTLRRDPEKAEDARELIRRGVIRAIPEDVDAASSSFTVPVSGINAPSKQEAPVSASVQPSKAASVLPASRAKSAQATNKDTLSAVAAHAQKSSSKPKRSEAVAAYLRGERKPKKSVPKEPKPEPKPSEILRPAVVGVDESRLPVQSFLPDDFDPNANRTELDGDVSPQQLAALEDNILRPVIGAAMSNLQLPGALLAKARGDIPGAVRAVSRDFTNMPPSPIPGLTPEEEAARLDTGAAGGAFGRAAGEATVPTLSGAAGAATTAPIGGALGAPFGPVGRVIGTGAGALAGALSFGATVSRVQDSLFDMILGPEIQAARHKAAATDREQNPLATFVGEQIPQLLTGKPSLSLAKEANIRRLIGAGTGTAVEGAQQLREGKLNPMRLAGSAVTGALLSGDPTRIAKAIERPGASVGRRAANAILSGSVGDLAASRAVGDVSPVKARLEAWRQSKQNTVAETVLSGGEGYTPTGRKIKVIGLTPDGRRVQVEENGKRTLVSREIARREFSNLTPEPPAVPADNKAAQSRERDIAATRAPTRSMEDTIFGRVEMERPGTGKSGSENVIPIRGAGDLARHFQTPQEQGGFGYDADTATREASAWDDIAQAWAERNGKKPKDWYQSHLSGLQNGGQVVADRLISEARAAGRNVGSNPRAALIPESDGRQIISSLVNPDETSARHELSHVVRKMIGRENPDDAAVLDRWIGAEDGRWTAADEERFVTVLEKRQWQQTAPPSVKGVLSKVADYLRNIYGRVVQGKSDAELGIFNKQVLKLLKEYGLETTSINEKARADVQYPESVSSQGSTIRVQTGRGTGSPSSDADRGDVSGISEGLSVGDSSGGSGAEATGPGRYSGVPGEVLPGLDNLRATGGGREPVRSGSIPGYGDRGGRSPAGSGTGGSTRTIDREVQGGVLAPTTAAGPSRGPSVADLPVGINPAAAYTQGFNRPTEKAAVNSPTTPAPDLPSRLEFVTPESVEVEPGLQYKRSGIVDSKAGVTDALKGTDTFDVDQGGILTVFERRNGKRSVINGHHRLELANRATSFIRNAPRDGKVVPLDAPRMLQARILRESEGWTPDLARVQGALENLKDQKGEALDAADALSKLGDPERSAREVASLPKNALSRDTSGLLALDDTARAMVRAGTVRPSVAAAIGEGLKGDLPRQRAALKDASSSSLRTYEEGQRLAELTRQEDIKLDADNQGSLDLGDTGGGYTSTLGQQAAIQAAVARRIENDKKALTSILSQSERDSEVFDREGRMADAERLAEGQRRLARLFADGPVRDEVRAAAAEIASGQGKMYDAVNRVLSAVNRGDSLAKSATAEDLSTSPLFQSIRDGQGREVDDRTGEILREADGQRVNFGTGVNTATMQKAPKATPAVRDAAKWFGGRLVKEGATGATWTGRMKEAFGTWFKPEDIEKLRSASELSAATAKEVADRLEKAPLTSVDTYRALISDQPGHIAGVVDFLGNQRQKLMDGKMTPRDIAKSYYMTLASQGAKEMPADTIERKTGLRFDSRFTTVDKDGRRLIRPEEAAAFWLGTPDGQKALDAIEQGKYLPGMWAKGAKVRQAFGDDRFATLNALGTPKRGAFNLSNIAEIASQVNATGGDPAKLTNVVLQMNGIGAGKQGFLKHLLGLGDSPTIDAQEINFLLTGQGDISRLKTKEADLARRVKELSSRGPVAKVLQEKLTAIFEALDKSGSNPDGLPPEVWNHVAHQLVWEKAKGLPETHAGMYLAQSLYQRGAEPEPGDFFVSEKDGNTYRVDKINPDGSLRVAIERDGKRVAFSPRIAPSFYKEQRDAADPFAAIGGIAGSGSSEPPADDKKPLRTMTGRVPGDVTVISPEGVTADQLPEAPASPGLKAKAAAAKVRAFAVDAANAPRSIMASGDLSAGGRQGAVLSVNYPGSAAKATGEMLKSFLPFKGAEHYEKMQGRIEAYPSFAESQKAGLYLSETAKRRAEAAGDIAENAAEEAFASRLAKMYPGVQMSDRAYSAYLDTLRMDVYNKMRQEVLSKKLPEMEQARELSGIARYINVATGRGDVPLSAEMSRMLSSAFFAPKWAASRFQLLADPTLYVTASPVARKIAIRNSTRYAASVGTVLTLAYLAGADVTLDPDSADFGKVKVGNTRYEISAGLLPDVRFTLRVGKALYNNRTGKKNAYGKEPADIVAQFLRYKMAPMAGPVADTFAPQYAPDRYEKKSTLEKAIEMATPLIVSDLRKAYEVDGAKGVLKTVPSTFGISSSTYAAREKAKGEKGSSKKASPVQDYIRSGAVKVPVRDQAVRTMPVNQSPITRMLAPAQ